MKSADVTSLEQEFVSFMVFEMKQTFLAFVNNSKNDNLHHRPRNYRVLICFAIDFLRETMLPEMFFSLCS